MVLLVNPMFSGGMKKPVELVGFATQSSKDGSTTSVLDPSGIGIANGDLLLIVGLLRNSSYAVTFPAGFTNQTPGTITDFTHVGYKIASSESGSYTVTTNQSAARGNILVVLRNVGNAAGITFGGVTLNGTVTHTASSISPTKSGALLMFSFVSATTGLRTITTPPSGMTQVAYWYDFASNQSPSAACYIQNPQAAGATGTRQIVWSSSASSSPAFLVHIPEI
jgi:hypothetical protein